MTNSLPICCLTGGKADAGRLRTIDVHSWLVFAHLRYTVYIQAAY